MKAIAVFHGHGHTWWARVFGRAGFRHCFVAILTENYWIEIDGRAGVPRIRVIAGADFDLLRHYRAQRLTAIDIETGHDAPRTPLMFGTCVGAAKRILGVRAPVVLTPWQLYKHLRERNAKQQRPQRIDPETAARITS